MAHFQGASTLNFVAGGSQANQFWVPEIYSKKVQIALRKASTVEAICNTDYMGEIKSYGDTVNIVKEPQVAVATYTRGLTTPATALTDAELVLTIDRANYFSFQVDSLEKRFGHINFPEVASNNAAYKLKDNMDQEVMGSLPLALPGAGSTDMYSAATLAGGGALTSIGGNILGGTVAAKFGTVAAAIAINHGAGTDPLDFMARAAQALDEAANPEENRWFVAAPAFYNSLSETASKLLSVDYNAGKGSLRNGLVASGLIRGFAMYKSNNVRKNIGGNAAGQGVTMFGHMRSTSCASAMNTVESFRSPTTFADQVRGLHVYGRKVIAPQSIGVGIVNIT